MAKYQVIERFKDKDGKVYEVGQVYEGKRENVLSNKRNKYKRPFIEEVKEEKKKEPSTK